MNNGTLHLVTGGLDASELGALCHGLARGDAVVLVGDEARKTISDGAFRMAVEGPAGSLCTWHLFEQAAEKSSLPSWIGSVDAEQWAVLVERYGRTMTWGS